MISTFMTTLGPSYQLMLLTASRNNFTEVVDKATKVKLAKKAGLVPHATLILVSSTKNTPKGTITWREANLV